MWCRQAAAESLKSAALAPLEPVCISLNLPGRHNVLNATAATAVARWKRVGIWSIQGLAEFSGVGRRFQVYGEFS